MKPTATGWWWLWSVDVRAVDGWLPVRVYSTHRGLTFRDGSTETSVTVDGYTWGGPVTRIDPLAIEEAYRLGRLHERTDIVDFIEGPPGRIPDVHRNFIGELGKAIARATHEGWGKRLYTTPPPKAGEP